jgi:predicted ArsR family transcriptional regulator
MDHIELVPDLSHCIETVARKEYENLARTYLQADKGDSELEEKIELLRSFLESADFRKLRKQSEGYLLKGQKVKFILYRGCGEAKYKMLLS